MSMLTKNAAVKSVILFDINVKNKLAWSKLKSFADRVKH